MYSDSERDIAHHIAEALNDRLSIGLHLKYARKVPHRILRDALTRTLSVDEKLVVKSRASIYVSIIESYLKENHGSSGN
jgi:hypothetical protein